jgi:hypothetical protein
VADDKLAIPSLPSPGDRYDRQNEAAFRREVQFLMYEIDASLARFANTIQSGLIPHASTHDAGGTDSLSSYYYTIAAADAAFSALGHTHVEADITDLQAYLLDITGESIGDLSNVNLTGGLASDDILQYSGTHFVSRSLATAGISAVGHTHVEADITDLQSYLLNITGESLGDLGNVTDASSAAGWYLRTTLAGTWAAQLGLTEADVTAHQAALSITESQISDLGSYLTQAAADALYLALSGGAMTGAIDITLTGDIGLTVDTNTTPASFTSSVANTCWLQLNDVTGLGRVGWTGSGAFGMLCQTANVDINLVTNGTGVVKANGTQVSVVGHTHTESDITDLQSYLLNITGESLGDLSNVTDASSAAGWYLRSTGIGTWVAQLGLTEADVTAHQAALSITESQISDLSHTDATAIHDNVAGEIAAITEKASPVSGDLILIEDSAAANVKKYVQIGNLPTSDHGTLAGLGDDDHTQYSLVDGTRSFTGGVTIDGGATALILDGAQGNMDIKAEETTSLAGIVNSTNFYLQLDRGNADATSLFAIREDSGILGAGTELFRVHSDYAWVADNLRVHGTATAPALDITDIGTNDMEVETPLGSLYLRALGSTTPTGDGVYLDDGGTNKAKVAGIKNITATVTAPTGDYPYGTLHLIY